MTSIDTLRRYADWLRRIGRTTDRNVLDEAADELSALRAAGAAMHAEDAAMAFVVRWRRDGQFGAEGHLKRRAAIERYEAIWHELRESSDWAVALYECPHMDDVDAAIASVEAGGGLILAHRDHRTNDAAIRELRSMLEGKS